jgi:hypothetical protein
VIVKVNFLVYGLEKGCFVRLSSVTGCIILQHNESGELMLSYENREREEGDKSEEKNYRVYVQEGTISGTSFYPLEVLPEINPSMPEKVRLQSTSNVVDFALVSRRIRLDE